MWHKDIRKIEWSAVDQTPISQSHQFLQKGIDQAIDLLTKEKKSESEELVASQCNKKIKLIKIKRNKSKRHMLNEPGLVIKETKLGDRALST